LKNITTTLISIGLILTSHFGLAQTSPIDSKGFAYASEFSKLYSTLKEQYEGKDFKAALSTMEDIKILIASQVAAPKKADQEYLQSFDILYNKAKYPANLKFGDHTLKVFGSKDIFILGDDPKNIDTTHVMKNIFGGSFTVTYDGGDLINDVYCKINDQTEKIHYVSSNPKIVTVLNHEATDTNSAGRIIIHGVGSAIITLTLAGQSLELPLKVTKLPVYTCMPTDDIIKLFGLPDTKTFDIVVWPDHKYIDGLLYEPSASEQKSQAEHWFYNKFPKVVFALDGFPFLVQINDMGW